MKKLFLIVSLLLACSIPSWATEYGRDWRSTQTATTGLFNVLLASGPVRLHSVVVNSKAANSTLKLFRGFTSTGAAQQFEQIDCSENFSRNYDIVFSSGLMYGKDGVADITILWDFEGTPFPGHYGDGHR